MVKFDAYYNQGENILAIKTVGGGEK